MKHERERKGRRWIFNLSSTPTKGSQSLYEISAQIHRREKRGGTLTCLLSKSEKMGREVRRKRVAAAQIPQLTLPMVRSATQSCPGMLPTVRFSSPIPHLKFQCR